MPTVAQSLAAELEREAAATRRLMERVPADRLDWQPHPKAMSLGQLALHLATIPANICRMCSRDAFDAATANFAPASPADAAALLPALDGSLAEARGFLAELGEDGAAAPWRLTMGEQEVMTLPKAEVVRTLLLNHWYHHRGQLSVYLRILDVPIPVIYGRSADENPFAQAVPA